MGGWVVGRGPGGGGGYGNFDMTLCFLLGGGGKLGPGEVGLGPLGESFPCAPPRNPARNLSWEHSHSNNS